MCLRVISHDVFDMNEKTPAERAAGVAAGEVFLAEAFRRETCHGKRVSERERAGRRACRREVERAGFAFDVAVDVNVGVAGERRLRITRHGNELGSLALDRRNNGEEFARFARIGNAEYHVVGRDHAEVAVRGFSRVHEKGRRPGRGECGGELAADVSGFADAGNDETPLDVED